jgi:purine-nucleoside phosphorylase
MNHDQIQQAASHVRNWTNSEHTPTIGIILGTGLGALTEHINIRSTIAYDQIPHFPQSTVQSHTGQLVSGQLANKNVIAMEGRLHLYEGYTPQQVTFPVRVMRALGCEILIVSNASGGLNPKFMTGDIMIIEDHINLMNGNPLTGPNDDRLGTRFPDMCHAYDPELTQLARKIANQERIPIERGVYAAVNGPNLETKAEYRFLRTIGADAVGMSTVPEIIVAKHAGMKTLGLSVITDMCLPDALEPTSLDKIITTAQEAEKKLSTLVRSIIASI